MMSTMIICAILGAAAFFAIRHMCKKGTCGCSDKSGSCGGCSGCSHSRMES